MTTFLVASSDTTPTPTPPSGFTGDLPILQADTAVWVIAGLVVLIALVAFVPPALAWAYRPRAQQAAGLQAGETRVGFFQIPFITWFLLHYTIAAMGVVAVLILAIDRIIDKSVASALLGALFGYVLGSSSRGQLSTTPGGAQQPQPGPQPPH